MNRNAGQIWVQFIAGGDEQLLYRIAQRANVRLSRYKIDYTIDVVGRRPTKLVAGVGMVRIESDGPIELGEGERKSTIPTIALHGITQPLNYTSEAQRRELDARSHSALEPSSDTKAVLIPIRKSPQWWQLPGDRRRAHFQTSMLHEGHTAIRTRYVDRVYRKLYHSRNMNPRTPCDFLTYFEFRSAHQDDFNKLLKELRDVARNPEWHYVELEYEIWMTKVG